MASEEGPASGSSIQQVKRGQLAGGQRGGDPVRVEPLRVEPLRVDLAELRPGVGEHARLAQAAAVGVGGDFEQPGAVCRGEPQRRRRGRAAHATAALAVGAGGQALVPQHDDLLAGGAQCVEQLSARPLVEQSARARRARAACP